MTTSNSTQLSDLQAVPNVDKEIVKSILLKHLRALVGNTERDGGFASCAALIAIDPAERMDKVQPPHAPTPATAFSAGFDLAIDLTTIVLNKPFAPDTRAISAAINHARRSDLVCFNCVSKHSVFDAPQASAAPTPAPRGWPKVKVRPTTDAERAEALAAGTESLKILIAQEEEKLRILRGLHRTAQAVAGDPQALNDPAAMQSWERGLDALNEVCKAEESPSEKTAAKLAIVSGHRVFASGGAMSRSGDFTPVRREHALKEMVEFGSANVDAAASYAQVLDRAASPKVAPASPPRQARKVSTRKSTSKAARKR